MTAIDDCLGNAESYAAYFSGEVLPAAPARKLAVVACMDARLDVNGLLGLRQGDAHVIRNAGGVVTDDVIRSLAVSQHLLETREIMLIQHTDCGLLRFTDSALKDAIEQGAGARPPFAMQAFADLEQSVRASVGRLRASPFIAHGEAIRGFVYEVETGRLREVHP